MYREKESGRTVVTRSSKLANFIPKCKTRRSISKKLRIRKRPIKILRLGCTPVARCSRKTEIYILGIVAGCGRCRPPKTNLKPKLCKRRLDNFYSISNSNSISHPSVQSRSHNPNFVDFASISRGKHQPFLVRLSFF